MNRIQSLLSQITVPGVARTPVGVVLETNQAWITWNNRLEVRQPQIGYFSDTQLYFSIPTRKANLSVLPKKTTEVACIKEAVIADVEATQAFLKFWLHEIQQASATTVSWPLGRVVIPSYTTTAQKKILQKTFANLAGTWSTQERAEILRTLMGSRGGDAALILYVGYDESELLLVNEGQVVQALAIPNGWHKMTQTLDEAVRLQYGLSLDRQSTDEVWQKLLKVSPSSSQRSQKVSVRGKDLQSQQPVNKVLDLGEFVEVVEAWVAQLSRLVQLGVFTLQRTHSLPSILQVGIFFQQQQVPLLVSHLEQQYSSSALVVEQAAKAMAQEVLSAQ